MKRIFTLFGFKKGAFKKLPRGHADDYQDHHFGQRQAGSKGAESLRTVIANGALRQINQD